MSYVKQCDKCKKIITDTEKFVNASPVDTPVKEQLHLCQACNEAFKRDFLRIPVANTSANPQASQPSVSSVTMGPNAIR